MKTLPYILPLVFAGGFMAGRVTQSSEPETVRQLINYAAQTPTTEAGGVALRNHPQIGAITNILIEPGRLSVFGRKGSRVWYYPK